VSPYRQTIDHLLANPLLLALQVAASALLVRGFLRRAASGSHWPAIELAAHLSVLPVAMLALTLLGYRNMYLERHLLVTIPFFALALARGASGFSSRRLNGLVPAAVVVLGIVSYVAFLRSGPIWTVYKHNPDWRSAARFVDDQYASGERQVLICVIPIDDFDFYLRREMGSRRPQIRWYDDKNYDRLVASAPGTQIVVVKNVAWASGVDRVIDRFVKDARLRRASVARFTLVELHSFERVLPALASRS
jgi:hypothetical protein